MNLLIVTNLWTGIKPFFLEGHERFHGLPSFSIPFLKILNTPEFEKIYIALFVDLTRHSGKLEINLPSRYKDRLAVSVFYFRRYRDVVLKLPLLLPKIGREAKLNDVSVIFGHGMIGGAVAGLVSTIFGFKNVRRVYGIHPSLLSKGKLQLLLSNPLEFLTFTLPCEALIVTNDGSGADRLFHRLNGGASRVKEFFFLLNGVYKDIEKRMRKPENIENLPERYISYVARFETWKGHLRFLEVLSVLKARGVEIPGVFVGQVYNRDYYNEVLRKIETLGLSGNVYVIPGLPWDETMYILANSTVSCLLYDFNLSNVFLESLALGVPVVALNTNRSLDPIPDDVFVKLPEAVSDDAEKIADAIEELLKNTEKRQFLSHSAKEFVINNLKDWDERAEFEISLLKKAANARG